MALNSAIAWECRTTGADTNGGGFRAGATGTDWSQQDSPQYAVTDGVTAGSTTVTSASAAFGTDVVGNLVYIAGGTGAVVGDWYEVISRTNATTIVVDRSTGLTAGTGVTIRIGGAILSPGIVAAKAVGNNAIWIKAGTYTITSTTAGVAGGKVSTSTSGAFNAIMRWEGYSAARGDKGTRPIIAADSVITSFTLVSLTGQNVIVDNITVDGNSRASSTGLVIDNARSMVLRCKAQNCTVSGIMVGSASGSPCVGYRLEATGCSGTAAIQVKFDGWLSRSIAWANTTVGFLAAQSSTVVGCIASLNTGASSDGFNVDGAGCVFSGNVSYGSGRHGFNFPTGGGGTWIIENCIAEGNAGYGFTATSFAHNGLELHNCAGFNNTSGNVNTTTGITGARISFVTGTASFFTDPTNGDFSLNTLAGGGALARAAGYPGLMPRGINTGYTDIGAIQHQENAARIVMGGGAVNRAGTY